jgi:hypothetical protein
MAAFVVSALMLVGFSCLFMVRWAPLFDSCRVLYRTHNVAADTWRCRVFSVLNVAMIVLLVAAVIAGLTLSILLRGRRNGTAST